MSINLLTCSRAARRGLLFRHNLLALLWQMIQSTSRSAAQLPAQQLFRAVATTWFLARPPLSPQFLELWRVLCCLAAPLPLATLVESPLPRVCMTRLAGAACSGAQDQRLSSPSTLLQAEGTDAVAPQTRRRS
jgi:hypothetical protein